MLSALLEAGAEFLVVGAHALALHGRPRATGDLDIWVRATRANAERVWEALLRFGAPLRDLTREDLTGPGLVYQIGLPPRRIDLLTSITGVSWPEAWSDRVHVDVQGISVPVLGKSTLIANKRATGRAQDLVDVAALEADPGSGS